MGEQGKIWMTLMAIALTTRGMMKKLEI